MTSCSLLQRTWATALARAGFIRSSIVKKSTQIILIISDQIREIRLSGISNDFVVYTKILSVCHNGPAILTFSTSDDELFMATAKTMIVLCILQFLLTDKFQERS